MSRDSILSKVANWSLKKKAKAALLDAVRKTRGPGHGVDVPLTDTEDPERVPVFVAALEEIVQEHPELQVVISPRHLTLCYKADYAQTIAADLRATLERDGLIAKPGEELPMEARQTDGSGAPEDLYTPEELEAMKK